MGEHIFTFQYKRMYVIIERNNSKGEKKESPMVLVRSKNVQEYSPHGR